MNQLKEPKRQSKKVIKNVEGILVLMIAFLWMFSSATLTVSAKKTKDDLTPNEKSQIEKELKIGEDDGEFDPDADPYETGVGVHADPAVFEKDFCLTVDQKIYTITEIERVVSEIIEPDMSDLEKYYTLAIWVNKHVAYDWEFWSGRYNFEFYSHQWDSYGGMKEDERSVCAGIAIFYATMCHAADLPCYYVRMQPSHLDHTINYIPDINGNAYYVDVTEDLLFMSDEACPWDPLDKEFSHITKDALDNSFNYSEGYGSSGVSHIKEYYDTPFEDWFKEYALHQDTDKTFNTEYVEKGSGEKGKHIATYHSCRSNRTENPDIWFLDDFYSNPSDVAQKIKSGTLDESITNISGVNTSYDCDIDELQSKIEENIKIEFFPSVENGNIVAKKTALSKGEDYEIALAGYDEDAKKATFTINGKGKYKGSQSFTVKVKTAVVEVAPARKADLVYNEGEQELVEAGTAICGEMQYALGNENGPTEAFSTNIPTAKNAGEYHVWYKAVGNETYGSTDPEKVKGVITIGQVPLKATQEKIEINVGETVPVKPVVEGKFPATFTYSASEDKMISIDETGNLTGIAAGETEFYIGVTLDIDDPNYETETWLFVEVAVYESIDNVRIRPGVYDNDKELVPEVVFKGKTLKEGTDYTLEKVNEKDVFKTVGEYKVKLKGKGVFKGEAAKIFTIVQSEEAASKAVTDAKKELADVQEEITNMGGTATTVDVENALKNLVNAQKKLEEAEEVLANTKTILSKDEVEQLEGQIEGLKQELKKQAVDIQNKIGDRISELEYELQQRMIEKDESEQQINEQLAQIKELEKESGESEKQLQQRIDNLEQNKVNLEKSEKQLKEQIKNLEQQIKGINDQFATKSIIDISSYPYEINLEKKSYPYTGKAIKPAVKVQGLSAQNYTVTYSNNTKIGTATVTVTAKGDKYTGKIQTTFEITKMNNTLEIKGNSVTLKYKKMKKTQRLNIAKVIKFNNKGQGALTYSKVSGNKKITINKKTGKVTIKKGLKKGTYKVKVKVDAGGNDTYLASPGETVTFKVKIK